MKRMDALLATMVDLTIVAVLVVIAIGIPVAKVASSRWAIVTFAVTVVLVWALR